VIKQQQKKKKIAIIQSNYIPWKGYFDIINSVDEFILFDDVQYTIRDWRNRNRIKTSKGVQWLQIPVKVKGKYFQKIKDTKIADKKWGEKHWKTLKYNYSRAPFFNQLKDIFEELYLNSTEQYLSEINLKFITAINKLLGITTKLSWSDDYRFVQGKTVRIVDLCKQTRATQYLSGPSAKNYIDESLFKQAQIKVVWMDYAGYPTYKQRFPPFIHKVSILDLLFNTGHNATRFMKSFTKKKTLA